MKKSNLELNIKNLDDIFPNINRDIEHALTYFSDDRNMMPSVIVMTAGHEACDKNKRIIGPGKYDYFIIHYIMSGSGVVNIKKSNGEKEQLKVKEHEVFIIGPGLEYSYFPDRNNPWEYSWISFVSEGNTNMFSQLLGRDDCIIKLKKYKPVEKAFAKIGRISSYKYAKNSAVMAIFYECVSEIMENCMNPIKSDNDKNHIKECLTYIQDNYQNPDLSLKDVADHLYLNEKYLSRIFSGYMGMPLFKYINSIRIKMACFELANHSLSISTISNDVGFSDPLYFSKKFKQVIGVSPLNYRKYIINKK